LPTLRRPFLVDFLNNNLSVRDNQIDMDQANKVEVWNVGNVVVQGSQKQHVRSQEEDELIRWDGKQAEDGIEQRVADWLWRAQVAGFEQLQLAVPFSPR